MVLIHNLIPIFSSSVQHPGLSAPGDLNKLLPHWFNRESPSHIKMSNNDFRKPEMPVLLAQVIVRKSLRKSPRHLFEPEAFVPSRHIYFSTYNFNNLLLYYRVFI